jgi:hypothetical protein
MYVFRLFLILISVTLVAATIPRASRIQQEAVSSTKHSIEINQLLMNDALQKVGEAFSVVIGEVQTHRANRSQLINLTLKQVTLPEALNQLVKADPNYTWEFGSDGAVRVHSIEAPPAVEDVILFGFSIDNLYRREVSQRLDEQAEVQTWLREHGCKRTEYSIGHDWEDDKTRISFHTTGKTLRENLDIIALNAQTYFWSITRLGDFDDCEISIKL